MVSYHKPQRRIQRFCDSNQASKDGFRWIERVRAPGNEHVECGVALACCYGLDGHTKIVDEYQRDTQPAHQRLAHSGLGGAGATTHQEYPTYRFVSRRHSLLYLTGCD